MVEITEDGVIYESQTRLLELAVKVSDIRNISKPEAEALIEEGFNIYSSLQALEYKLYLTKEDRESIWYCLIKIAGINDTPVSPVVGTVEPPAIIVGVPGKKGDKGDRGADGGATDFQYNGATMTTVVDTFPIASAYAARWNYIITGDAQRAGEVIGTWTADGASVQFFDYATNDIGGDTGPLSLSVDYFGGQIRLLAVVNSGTWNIRGSRYFIPNMGAGVQVDSFLTNGKIWIGNSLNQPTEQMVVGDVTLNSSGVSSISDGAIVDQDISTTANISVQKLESNASNTVAVYDGNGKLTSSIASSLLNFLVGLTGNIQAQINNAATNITGAITPFVANNAIPDRVIVSSVSGKFVESSVTVTQLQTATIPVGMIMIWSGSVASIPGGWQLCDGTNGTKDLRGLFIAGAGGAYPVGLQQGENFVELNVSQMPSHSHSYTDNGHTHRTGGYDRLLRANGVQTVGAVDNTPGEPQLTTSTQVPYSFIDIQIQPTGNGQAHENRPPFLALCYIQKI